MPFCNRCGEAYSENDSFCPKCGSQFSSEENKSTNTTTKQKTPRKKLVGIVLVIPLIISLSVIFFNKDKIKIIAEETPTNVKEDPKELSTPLPTLKITKTDWNNDGCSIDQSTCERISDYIDQRGESSSRTRIVDDNVRRELRIVPTYTGWITSCGRVLFDLSIPQEVTSVRNALCTLIISEETSKAQKEWHEFEEGINELPLGNLDIREDHTVQLCCKGGWEDTKAQPTACQTIILQNVC